MNDPEISSETSLEECSDSVLSVTDKLENGKNKHIIKCQFCPSHILNPGLGTYWRSKFKLPMMTKKTLKPVDEEKNKQGENEWETLASFWQVSDMYSFENIGFSNTVGDVKYLACADCEIGPVGYYNMNTKVSYVALARVCHID